MGFALQLLVEGIVALGLSLYYGWKLTLVILASLPVSALILHLISRGLQSNIVLQSEALSEASHIANNAIAHISLLKYFNTQNQESLRYVRSVRKAAEFYLKQARTNALQMGFTKFASTTMFVQGKITFGNKHNLRLTICYRLLVRVGARPSRIDHSREGHYHLLEYLDGCPSVSGHFASSPGPCQGSSSGSGVKDHH